MKTWKYSIGIALFFIVFSCAKNQSTETAELTKAEIDSITDPAKGIGVVRNVALNTPLELDRVEKGKAIYEGECNSCHTLDDQRLVGPGWKDITKRRKPEWIMNMITNVDVMLDNDDQAQELLESCGTRMAVEVLTLGEARDVLEFMRQNDGEK
ncbi:MAG: c-type cytochrome [Cyclobacteriaceae bacterium]|nr:c-type cytochrome [Cyclobacteriaceae bacterium]